MSGAGTGSPALTVENKYVFDSLAHRSGTTFQKPVFENEIATPEKRLSRMRSKYKKNCGSRLIMATGRFRNADSDNLIPVCTILEMDAPGYPANRIFGLL